MDDSQKQQDIKDYSSFCPKKYFTEYYDQIGEENLFLLKFFNKIYKPEASDIRLLEFGGGPVIYQLISAARQIKEIVFTDYLEVNRKEIKNWLDSDPNALGWNHYFNCVLKLNGMESSEINRRKLEENLKIKITDIIECDAYLPSMLGKISDNKFDVVSSNFCLDCISDSEKLYIEFIEKTANLLEKRGKLVLTMLKNSRSYKIDNLEFPAFPVNEEFIRALLYSMNFSEIEIETCEAEDNQGYDGIIALSAVKNR